MSPLIPLTFLSSRMTPEKIKALCKKNDLYMTPGLNEVLYLHFQGFAGIAGLEDYTQLKCLWLDSNAITEIRGLDNQRDLRCLFLQNNLIRVIIPSTTAPSSNWNSPNRIAANREPVDLSPTGHTQLIAQSNSSGGELSFGHSARIIIPGSLPQLPECGPPAHQFTGLLLRVGAGSVP